MVRPWDCGPEFHFSRFFPNFSSNRFGPDRRQSIDHIGLVEICKVLYRTLVISQSLLQCRDQPEKNKDHRCRSFEVQLVLSSRTTIPNLCFGSPAQWSRSQQYPRKVTLNRICHGKPLQTSGSPLTSSAAFEATECDMPRIMFHSSALRHPKLRNFNAKCSVGAIVTY
jgi:hypothetical protein